MPREDHATGGELRFREAADELDLLAKVELARQAESELAGKLGVVALLGGLDGVPQALAILHPGRCMAGGQDLGMDGCGVGGWRAAAAAMVLVAKGLGGTDGGSGDGGAAVAAGDDGDRAVVDGHAQSALALAVAQPMTVGGLRSMVLQS